MDKVLSDNVNKLFLFLTIQQIANQTYREKPSNDKNRCVPQARPKECRN